MTQRIFDREGRNTQREEGLLVAERQRSRRDRLKAYMEEWGIAQALEPDYVSTRVEQATTAEAKRSAELIESIALLSIFESIADEEYALIAMAKTAAEAWQLLRELEASPGHHGVDDDDDDDMMPDLIEPEDVIW